jgi:hypothetical protein
MDFFDAENGFDANGKSGQSKENVEAVIAKKSKDLDKKFRGCR